MGETRQSIVFVCGMASCSLLPNAFLRSFARALVAGLLLCSSPVTTAADPGGHWMPVALPAGEAQETLLRFGQQTGRQLLYRSDHVAGVRTRAVRGLMSPQQAIGEMLQGTVLTATTTARGVIAVVRREDNNEDKEIAMSGQAPTPSLWSRIVTGVFSSLVAGGTAVAQTGQGPVLEEVIVTAQKRSQTLRDVAMTVNVVSARDFQDSMSFDFADIDRLVAGLDVRGDSFDTDIVLRGVGTDLSAPVSPRVTAYLDGAFLNSTSGIYVAQYDLAQFEVLRGSQGTLYGKASPAGAITIRTASPSLETVEGYLRQSWFSRDGSNSQFALSAPLVEGVLGARVAGVYDDNRNADISNRFLDEEASKQTSSGRLTLLYQPFDHFTSRLSYQYTEYAQDYFEALAGAGPIGTFDAADREAAGNVRGYTDIREKHAVWENSLTLGNHDITAITFYQEQYTERLDDRDVTPAEADRQEVRSNYAADWNQEVRIATSLGERWDHVGGIYYANSDVGTTVDRTRGGGSQLLDIDIDIRSEDWGVFSHHVLQLRDDTTLTAGLRWTRERRYNATELLVTIPSLGLTLPIPADDPDKRQRTFRAWTGTLKLQHDWSDDLMSYVSYDRAFRAGSGNVSSGIFPAQFTLFDEETSHSFEAGLKTRFLDGAGELSASVYYQIYDDFQYQADNIPVCETVGERACEEITDFSAVVPAEEVVSTGFELESRMLLGENWSLFAAVSYNSTEFESFANAPCDAGTVPNSPLGFATCDLGGEDIGVAPDWSGVFSGEYARPLEGLLSGAEWYLRALVNVQASVRDPGAPDELPGHGIVDLFGGLRNSAGLWELSLWARNLLDKDAVIDSSFVSAFPEQYRAVRLTDPRSVGVTASYHW